ncbi:hypothetical protein F5Y15DRAFT_267477 [Xylariaceae sp. FL0016]|nr:hypothetical protein F5Y15DRAFT_267477 [Xylariaceae sp. FL0016]
MSTMYRRNGKPQSCEPCRKWKIRCDHGRPICQRCIGRDIASKCFYHPGPMSSRQRPTGTLPPNTITKSPRQLESSNPPGFGDNLTNGPGSSAPLDAPEIEVLSGGTSTVPGRVPCVATADVHSGRRVLELLYHNGALDTLVFRSSQRSRVPLLPHRVLDAILQSVHRLLDRVPTTDIDQYLNELSAQISQNSAQALHVGPSTTVEEYILSFTGSSLRWEALGNVFAVAGRSLVATPVNEAVFPEDISIDRSTLLSQIAEATDICLSFCETPSCSNELLVSLQVNNVMLKTQQYGDSSYQAWKRLADLSATLYHTGIHQDHSSDSGITTGNDPAFLAQWKRGCFAAAFYVDKCVATFLGRPPLLNYRHCSLTLPLDLSDSALSGDSSLLEAIQDLDPSGWNRHGHVFRSSLARIRLLLAIFRDQVLETIAGPYVDDVSIRATQVMTLCTMLRGNDTNLSFSHVLEEAQAAWEKCPNNLRYDSLGRDVNEEQHSNADNFTILSAYLDYLHSRFLLLRYLAGHADERNHALLDTSRQILSTILKSMNHRTSSVDMAHDYSWITLYYGLPSAMLLAQELHNPRNNSNTPSAIRLPTSEIVRNLCVFTSNLAWVTRPSHGDYGICKDAERRLSHLVDSFLDHLPSFPETSFSAGAFEPSFEWTEFEGNLDFGSVLFT